MALLRVCRKDPMDNQTTAPLQSVRLADWRVPGLHHTLGAYIDKDGDLVIDGCDFGSNVERLWGDSDYEFAWHIASEWKDTVLLNLLKERFEAEPEWVEHETLFKEWLTSHGVPTKFWCFI
jgi:hypothetical protein